MSRKNRMKHNPFRTVVDGSLYIVNRHNDGTRMMIPLVRLKPHRAKYWKPKSER